MVRGRQDTAEAGGGTPPPAPPPSWTKATTTGRGRAGARRALGLVLRGDAHFRAGCCSRRTPGVCVGRVGVRSGIVFLVFSGRFAAGAGHDLANLRPARLFRSLRVSGSTRRFTLAEAA